MTVELKPKPTRLDVERWRQDFPILTRQVRGKPLVYLDNAATTLKPEPVIQAVDAYLRHGTANVHRGVHFLSEDATTRYEGAREKVRAFLNARSTSEIIFTSGTTASINLVARGYGRKFFEAGDEVILTHLEHHSNIVPWQMLAEEAGVVIKVAPINDKGEVILEEMEKLFSPRTKLVACSYVSNALGTINPVGHITRLAREFGALVLLDAAQAVAHIPVDVQELDCDFLAFSGHKIFGPTGIGVLYGRKSLLAKMPPVFGGGDMIRTVTFEKSTYADLPYRHEAGTPNIAGAIGLGAAIDYVREVGLEAIASWETELLAYGTEALSSIPGLRLIGTAERKASILGFVLDGIHPHDIGSVLDSEGIAIRAGHHCAQPVMQFFKVPATARASLSFYNTKEEIDALVRGIHKVQELFR